MKSNAVKFHSLSRRIVAQFCIFTLFMSAVYGLFSFILLYNLEDTFIEREVSQEANYLSEQYRKTGTWPAVRYQYLTLHYSKDSFPDDLKPQSIAEPNRSEFYGDEGRHYHLYPFPEYQEVYLLAEVSQRLLVRPIRGNVITLLAYCGLALTLIACLIAWLLGRKTAKPLRELADLVDGVAPENIPDSFAHRYPNNEIGILARKLEQSMRQLSQAIEREKCFTRDVSHELRTPVAIIKNAVELYQAKNSAHDPSLKIINRIADASIQMEQTVTTLLVLAREEHTAAAKVFVKLLPLIEQAVLDNHYLLKEKSVEVKLDDNCDVSVLAQAGMLKVLLDNLLSNAFQYTDSGEVNISFVDAKLVIEDTGPGIDASISSSITEPAIKGSQSSGYGFGLSIVKRLCEHQGWQLTVESHQGTRVLVAFA
jgi:signal transduction histidine kinase